MAIFILHKNRKYQNVQGGKSCRQLSRRQPIFKKRPREDKVKYKVKDEVEVQDEV